MVHPKHYASPSESIHTATQYGQLQIHQPACLWSTNASHIQSQQEWDSNPGGATMVSKSELTGSGFRRSDQQRVPKGGRMKMNPIYPLGTIDPGRANPGQDTPGNWDTAWHGQQHAETHSIRPAKHHHSDRTARFSTNPRLGAKVQTCRPAGCDWASWRPQDGGGGTGSYGAVQGF